MASPYDDYYKQAFDLSGHVHDVVDNPNHPQAVGLRHEINQLADDFRMEKDPRHLDERLKTIDHQLEQAQMSNEPVMSYADLDDLKHRFRRMRESIHKLPNF